MKTFLKSNWIAVVLALSAVVGLIDNIGGAIDAWNKTVLWLQENASFPSNSQLTNVLLFVLVLAILAIAKHLFDRATVSSPANEERERKAYLAWLKKDIAERLESSLHQARFIDLGLEEKADSIQPWVYKYQKHGQVTEYHTFDEVFANDKRILLLGDPGSGKTTTLLKLAEKFHQQAQDPETGIPFLFNLSLWGSVGALNPEDSGDETKHKLSKIPSSRLLTPKISDWLVKMIDETPGTGVSREVAEKWIQEGKITLLLDGLDEADEALRARLLDALNDFLKLKQNANITAVICSRTVDYEALVNTTSTKLLLDTAIILQPLTDEQIDKYLDEAQTPSLRKALQEDPELLTMAQTPLNLSLMVHAYGDGKVDIEQPSGPLSLTLRRQHLFEAYIDAMMQRQARRAKGSRYFPDSDFNAPKRLSTKYSREQVNQYLGWLAARMSENSKTSFRANTLYSIFPDQESDIFFTTSRIVSGLWVFLLSFLATLIIAPGNIFPATLVESLLISGITLLLFFVVPFIIKKLEDMDSEGNKIFFVYVGILLVLGWFTLVLLSAYILGGVNILLPINWIGWSLLIIGVIVINYLIVREEKKFTKAMFWGNIFAISAVLVGLFLIKTPIIHISLMLTSLAFGIGMLIGILDEPSHLNTLAFNATISGFALGTLGSLLEPTTVFLFCTTAMIVTSYWNKRFNWLPGEVIINSLGVFFLALRGHLPWRVKVFLSYACKSLLLKKSSQGYEFIHRRLRDHFALRELVPQVRTSDIEKRRLIAHELTKLKDASCDVLMELISDDDKMIRLDCIKGLTEIGSAVAAQTLLTVIRITEKGIKEKALDGLEKIKDPAAVPLLIEAFKVDGAISQIGISAQKALKNMGKLSEIYSDSIYGWLELLKNGKPTEQNTAAKALGYLNAKEIVPKLIELIKSSDQNTRVATANALVRLDAAQNVPVDSLLYLLQNGDWDMREVRKSVIKALGDLNAKEAIPELFKLLKNADSDVRSSAARALGELNAKEMVPELLVLLKSDKWGMRNAAIEALGELKSKEAMPHLLELLEENNFHWFGLHDQVAEALKKIDEKELFLKLLELLKSDNSYTRHRAVSTFRTIESKEAAPELIKLLKDQNWNLQIAAAQALGNLNAKEIVPELMELIKTSNQNTRGAIAYALIDLDAAKSVPTEDGLYLLKNRITDVDEYKMCRALRETATKAISLELMEILKSDNKTARMVASQVLGDLNAKEVIPELTKLLKTSDSDKRGAVTNTLVRLRAANNVSMDDLLYLLINGDWEVRKMIPDVLGELNAKEAVPELLNLLEENPYSSDIIIAALANLNATEAVPKLLELLKDDKQSTRKVASEALGVLKATDSFTELLVLLQNSNWEIRKSAIHAFVGIFNSKMAVQHNLLLT